MRFIFSIDFQLHIFILDFMKENLTVFVDYLRIYLYGLKYLLIISYSIKKIECCIINTKNISKISSISQSAKRKLSYYCYY